MNKKFIFLSLFFFTNCSSPTKVFYQQSKPSLMSINIIDQNGLKETISSVDRLKQYENVDFLKPQSYQKVFRIYQKDHDGSAKGVITTYHENSQLKQYLEVVNNRARGYYREFYPNGVMKLETIVLNGDGDIHELSEKTWLFDGTSRVWDENNQLIATIEYEKGNLEGLSTYYHSSGKVWKKIPYHKNQIDGCLEVFLESGELFQSQEYKSGLPDGKGVRFWKGEKLAVEEVFERGLLKTGSYFNQDGLLISEVVNGTGVRSFFGQNDVAELRDYVNGVEDGEVKVFTKLGTIGKSYHIKNGLKHGEEIEFYPLNPFKNHLQKKIALTWYEGKIHGFVKTWYENGVQESQREFHNNLKNGLSTAWYRDGSLMLIEEYNQGKLEKGDYFKKGEKYPISEIFLGSGTATLFDADGNFMHKVFYQNGVPDV